VNLVGIDLGVRKIAMAVFEGDSLVNVGVHEASNTLPRDLQLLEVASYAHDYGQLHEADSIWIEDTIIGNNRRYSIRLAETKGAIMADLANLRQMNGTDVRLVDNQTWKKHVVGDGHATKETVQNYIRATHPAYAPLCGEDQDLYDAACVGLYGLTITERAGDLHL
jgi:Holliday junction resolvasome RuvABC endonuclease subunit